VSFGWAWQIRENRVERAIETALIDPASHHKEIVGGVGKYHMQLEGRCAGVFQVLGGGVEVELGQIIGMAVNCYRSPARKDVRFNGAVVIRRAGVAHTQVCVSAQVEP
jgi:hypothetical protein